VVNLQSYLLLILAMHRGISARSKQFQNGYLQALIDLESILSMIDKEEKKEKK